MHKFSKLALSKSNLDFANLQGKNIIERINPFHEWLNARRDDKVWPYSKILDSTPDDKVQFTDEFGKGEHTGINFAIQDYLSLTTHPRIHNAIKNIIDKFGPHSAGSPMLAGNSKISKTVEQKIANIYKKETCLLFATGWMAGFGVIQGLVRKNDHIVIDQLSHACLQTGTQATQAQIWPYKHNRIEALEMILSQIREMDNDNGILVITEGLFSMDSDVPDVKKIQDLCHKYDAVLMVDVAHDFGSMGPDGTGTLGRQNMLGKVDIVMGAFSKTFACNGGFVACSKPVRDYLSIYSSPYTFSNAISPMQAAIVNECLDIIQSREGQKLRDQLMENVKMLRKGFEDKKHEVFGEPSPIVPVIVGNEKVARVASKLLNESYLLANLVEFPAVPIGLSRFRFQVMSSHTKKESLEAAKIFDDCVTKAEKIIQEKKNG